MSINEPINDEIGLLNYLDWVESNKETKNDEE